MREMRFFECDESFVADTESATAAVGNAGEACYEKWDRKRRVIKDKIILKLHNKR